MQFSMETISHWNIQFYFLFHRFSCCWFCWKRKTNVAFLLFTLDVNTNMTREKKLNEIKGRKKKLIISIYDEHKKLQNVRDMHFSHISILAILYSTEFFDWNLSSWFFYFFFLLVSVPKNMDDVTLWHANIVSDEF